MIRPPLTARYHRAFGKVRLAHQAYQDAWSELTTAAQGFEALHDWSSSADTWRQLNLVHQHTPVVAAPFVPTTPRTGTSTDR